jgi:hypothetical protein
VQLVALCCVVILQSVFTPTSSELLVFLSWYIWSAFYSAYSTYKTSNDRFVVKDGLEGNEESHEYSIRTRTSDKRAELTTASRIVANCFLNSFMKTIKF